MQDKRFRLYGRGFTLIELLVVMSIISLLSSIVFSSVNTARAKARNARRLSDVRQLIIAFNFGLNSNPALPDTGGTGYCVSATCYGGWASVVSNTAVDNFFTPFMTQKPVDPLGGTRGFGGYIYTNSYCCGPSGAGPYLNYLLEPPATCGFGVVNNTTSNLVNCYYRMDL